MRLLLGMLIAILSFVSCSPIHGIWNRLPSTPVKRVYGFYNYLPKNEDDREKRNTLFYWTPIEDYVQ